MTTLISVEDLQRPEEFEKGVQSTRTRCAAALALAMIAREHIRAERNGVPLPNSADILNSLREERLRELTGPR